MLGDGWISGASRWLRIRVFLARTCGALLAVAGLSLVSGSAAWAAVLHVTSSADSGPRTLRAAVAAAVDGDTVIVDPGVEPTLTSGPISVQGVVAIQGQGPSATTINASGASGVLDVGGGNQYGPNGTVSISQVTLTGGSSTNAGGGVLFASFNNLSLSDVQILGNAASQGGGGIAIGCNGGSVGLDRVTIANNTTGANGGGIISFCAAGLTATNTTIANNTAANGGGIYFSNGNATFAHTTIYGNTASGGSGGNINNFGGLVRLKDTIIAAGIASTGSNCSGPTIDTTTEGDNLEDTTPSQCSLSATQSDLLGVNPAFASTAPVNNGGPTDTLALQPTSPAVDYIPAASCAASTDQRGLPRPDRQEATCDIGAYEGQGQDQSPPEITITVPATGAHYQPGATVIAAYSCTDPDGAADVTSCAGPVPSGQPLDTSASGPHTFKVNAADAAGNTTSAIVGYTIADAALHASGLPVVARAQGRFTWPVAELQDDDPRAQTADYSVAVSWGDGSRSTGLVQSRPGGGFAILGTHVYRRAGLYSIIASIHDRGGAAAVARSTAIVLPPVHRICPVTGCLPPLRPPGCQRYRQCVPGPPPHQVGPAPVLCGPPSSRPYSNGVACTLSATSHTGETEYVISNPIVDRASYKYEPIVFRPGDLITIHGGGCVQTGGAGATWKRYVNPSGPDSGPNDPGLYHGTIAIPGAFLSRSFQSVQGLSVYQAINGTFGAPGAASAPLEIRSANGPTAPAVLTLGYRDGQGAYGDNGYYAHDNGTHKQCSLAHDGGNAWLIIDVVHGPPLPLPSPPTKAFDLLPTGGYDSNWFPENPTWGFQQANGPALGYAGDYGQDCNAMSTRPAPSSCTSDVTWENPAPDNFLHIHVSPVCNSFLRRPSGHINWGPVDVSNGWVYWDSWDPAVKKNWPFFGDNDYTLQLLTPPAPDGRSHAGAVPASNQTIGLEFNSGEVIDHYDSVQWWHTLHDRAVQTQSPYNPESKAGYRWMRDHFNAHPAVALGLMGLDGVHGAHSEIHPVDALAIREDDTTTDSSTWAFFARNWGNEGTCSTYQEYLNTQVLTLRIPPRDLTGPLRPTVQLGKVIGSSNHPAMMVSGDKTGVYLTFYLPPPDSHGWVAGEVHITWTLAYPTRDSRRSVKITPNTAPPPSRTVPEPGTPERTLASEGATLGSTPLSLAESLITPWQTLGDRTGAPSGTGPVTLLASSGIPTPPGAPATVSEAYDPFQVASLVGREYGIYVASGAGRSPHTPTPRTTCLLLQAAKDSPTASVAPGLPRYDRLVPGVPVASKISSATLKRLTSRMPACR